MSPPTQTKIFPFQTQVSQGLGSVSSFLLSLPLPSPICDLK